MNPGYSVEGEEREQGPLPRRRSRDILEGFLATWQTDYLGVFASQASQSAVVTRWGHNFQEAADREISSKQGICHQQRWLWSPGFTI